MYYMKVLYITIAIIIFIAGSNTAFSQSPDGPIQNTTSQAFFNCTDTMEQNMKTKLMSFDQERAKAAAINYDKFQSEVKGDKYTFHAISEEWANDQEKCDATLKSVLVLFNVFDESGKQRDVTVLEDPVSYQPQSIDVVNEIVKHGGIRVLPPLQQFNSGISTNDISCKEGLFLAIKSQNKEPVCLKTGTISKLASRGFFYGVNTNEANYTTILIPPGSENPSSNKTYSPDVATIVLGVNNTVTWVNQAESANTIVPDMPFQQDGKSFGSIDVIKPGGSYQFTFTEPRTFAYHTEPHPWMKGKIIVLPPSNNTAIITVKSKTTNPDVSPNHVVDVVSIKSVPPVTPGGPTIQITLKNNNAKPVTSLNVTLGLNNNYIFDFKNVTESNPLTYGNSVSETKILIGGAFSSESAYPVIINGIADNIPFRYSENASIPYTKEIAGNTTLPASFEPCDTPYSISNSGIAVLYMPKNSVGKICVRYSNPNESKNASLTIFDSLSYQATKNITSWAEPSVISNGNSSVRYSIKTGNQTGLYGLTIFCTGIPLAVGYDDKSNFTLNDFPWEKSQTIYCPMMTYQYKIDSLSGIGVTYIPYP